MPKRTRSFRSWQLEKLADPKRAASYLNACLTESTDQFLIALGKVAQANQMSKVAKDAGVQRETLYRSLSEQGNPTIGTLDAVLKAVGLRIAIEAASAPENVLAISHHGLESAARQDFSKEAAICIPEVKFAKQNIGAFRMYVATPASFDAISRSREKPVAIGPLGIVIPSHRINQQDLVWSS